LTLCGLSGRFSANPSSKSEYVIKRQIVYVLLGCLLAAGATWAVNELYHFGGAFGRLDQINPLFVQETQAIPQDAVRYLHWESQDFGQSVTLVVHNNDVALEDINGHSPGKLRQQFLGPAPTSDYHALVEKLLGRGFVTIIQQPTRANNYTTKVKIEDPYGENSAYALNVYLQTVTSER
jgi:hypothetical protein